MASDTVGGLSLPEDGKNLDIGGSQDLGQMVTALRQAVDAQFHKDGTATDGGSTTARITLGGTSVVGIYYGNTVPSISAGKGSIYLRVDGSATNNRMYINTNGSTGWTSVTTAA